MEEVSSSCQSCNAPLIEGSKFCGQCGTSVTSPLENPPAIRIWVPGITVIFFTTLGTVLGVISIGMIGFIIPQVFDALDEIVLEDDGGVSIKFTKLRRNK